MKILILGARGDVGSRIVAEALSRGHEVSAAVRDKAQISRLPGAVRAQAIDVSNTQLLAQLMAEHDVSISAIRPPDNEEQALVPLTRSLLDAAGLSHRRVLIVGGAASLKVPGLSGETVLSAPGFLPPSVKPIAEACFAQYELCAAETQADWTYLSPPAMLIPGLRTGRYRVGTDDLLVDEQGISRISMEDFALAMLDEAEVPRHNRRRFTVAA